MNPYLKKHFKKAVVYKTISKYYNSITDARTTQTGKIALDTTTYRK